jgi:dienelactone hydrolase
MQDFSAGPPSGVYSFPSTTPASLPELIRPQQGANAVNVVGHLFLPATAVAGTKVPAIVLLHGSGGLYKAMLEFWPQQFNAAGYAVLAVDSFGPRGVKDTTDDQSQVPYAADVADAFAALRLLASHPAINPDRIAVMGFSRGGIATFRTAVERIITAQQLPGGLRFAAHIPVYSGGCVGIFRLMAKPGVFSRAPMFWVHGDADDYTPIAACQDYATRIGAAGTPVEFVVIPGAHHKFDSDDPRRIFLRRAQKTLASCPLEMDIDTFYSYNRETGERLQGAAYQDVLKTACSAVGASVQGDSAARDKAAVAIRAFLARIFPK